MTYQSNSVFSLRDSRIGLIFLAVALVYFSADSACAQMLMSSNSSDRKYQFELLAAPSFCALRGNLGVDNSEQNTREIKIGYSVGVGVSRQMTKKFGVGALLLYERKGGKSSQVALYFDPSTQTFTNVSVLYDFRYDYITLPIMFNYYPRSKFGVSTGAFISWLNKQTLETTIVNRKSLSDETDLNSNTDAGLAIRFSYSLSLANRMVMVSIHQNIGLKNVRLIFPDEQTMKTYNVMLTLGLLL